MSDDLETSELISRSLRMRLSSEEQEKMDRNLESNEEAKKFANLSRLIQKSVAGNTPIDLSSPQDEDHSKLSQDARKRFQDSIDAAIAEQASIAAISMAGGTDSDTAPEIGTQTDGKHKLIASDSVSLKTADEQARTLQSRFRLIRRLGQGGLGNVWLARDEKLNRNVAIKELRPEALESPKAWQRFHREAEITGHLEHPNVVPLYQFGVDGTTGEPFYAMRFVGKRTLADAIVEHYDRVQAGQAGVLGLHRLLAVFLDVCQAIAYAHSRGIVHRDLKPENVALDNFGQVIVLDWGLAKVLEDSELGSKMSRECVHASPDLFSATIAGDVVGTPLYMSPEQAAGDLDRIDCKTDVYGLGATLFTILSGQAPHARGSAEHSDIKSMLKLIAESETPSLVDFECVPAELQAICEKAMSKKRHLRFESVSELATAVETWMAGQSDKQSGYDNLRMEGRELRADMESLVKNLERNALFAAGLPPIEQLMYAGSEEDVNIWRERLASIFHGLLRANPDYQNIIYLKHDREGQSFTELVRVERHGDESMNIRIVPRSRLRSEQASEYMMRLSQQKPEEVLTSLVCDPTCERTTGCKDIVGLLCGVPVYDAQTEDVFGMVMINCDTTRKLRRQMNKRMGAAEIVVACDVYHTMMHTKSGQIQEDSLSKKVAGLVPHFNAAVEHLQTNVEYIDDANSEIYGARLWFIPNVHGIMYLLKRT